MSIGQKYDFIIQWHLTERCNLTCRHCYQTGCRTAELSFSEVKDVIAEVEETFRRWTREYEIDFSPSFNVTGGEPFLRRDLFDILAELSGKGFGIYLLTNGTIISSSIAQRLRRLGVKVVQISIEGPEEVHDSIRGKGNFARSMKGIRHLLDNGLQVTLNATLSEINAGSFPDLIALASSLGIQKLGFSRLVPSGGGKKLINRMLSRTAVEDLYRKIFSLNTGDLKIVTGDPVASQYRSPEQAAYGSSTPSGGCAAGVSGLTILPDGTVTPCRRLPIPIGNVRTDSLREIWATSDVLNSLRNKALYQGKCGDCSKWASCRGCRAIAFGTAGTGDMNACLSEDPQCFLR